jgi:diaminopimelate epimerase
MVKFVKFQGTGNDFILIDGRTTSILNTLPVKQMCDRNFGIGADGLMILQNKAGYDFEMVYYNSDGNLSSMCGNGGRCIAQWANQLGLGNKNELKFWAPDGEHVAVVEKDQVRLKMNNVTTWKIFDASTVEINTGSPHYVQFTDNSIENYPLFSWAQSIRYNETYSNEGINVNISKVIEIDHLQMRTYERGVEDETLSCGTGVTATVLAHAILHLPNMENTKEMVHMDTLGGKLAIEFEKTENGFENIWLIGPAEEVFSGEWK